MYSLNNRWDYVSLFDHNLFEDENNRLKAVPELKADAPIVGSGTNGNWYNDTYKGRGRKRQAIVAVPKNPIRLDTSNASRLRNERASEMLKRKKAPIAMDPIGPIAEKIIKNVKKKKKTLLESLTPTQRLKYSLMNKNQ